MIPTKSTLALASLLPLLAHAQRQRGGGDPRDLELDNDITPACQSICRPVRQLAQVCDVDDDVVRDRLTAEYLGLQCYCLNPSFDVRNITALCASCIQQNPVFDDDDNDNDNDDDDRLRPEDDDIRDINNIMFRCGFPSSSYNAAAQATAADAIVVQAVRPTDPAQLTTWITAGVGQPTTAGLPGAGGALPTSVTSLRTTTFTTNFGLGPTTGTATVLATPSVSGGSSSVGGGTDDDDFTTTSDGVALPVGGLVGWKTVLGYTVGVAAAAAWFF